MKKINYLLIAIFSFFIFSFSVFAASSNFGFTVNMEPDIVDNEISLYLGYKGEEVNSIESIFSFDSTKLDLVGVEGMDGFTTEIANSKMDGKFKTLTIKGDSQYVFSSANYALITFRVTSKLPVGKSADAFVYKINASKYDGSQYRHNGYYLDLIHDSSSQMYFTMNDITENTAKEYWFKNYWYYIAIVVVVIFVLLIVVLKLLTVGIRKTEHREKKVSSQIKRENYNPNNTFKVYNKNASEKKKVNLNDQISISDVVNPFGTGGNKSDVQNSKVIDNEIKSESIINPFEMTVDNSKVIDNKKEEVKEEKKDDGGLITIASNNLEKANFEDVSSVPVFENKPSNESYEELAANDVSGIPEISVDGNIENKDNNMDVL